MKNAVDIQDITCSYQHVDVLKKMSFKVDPGEFFIIIGPNGSGKTTLVKTICGFLTPRCGAIFLLNRPHGDYNKRKLAKIIAYVPQVSAGGFPFTVMELVLMGRAPYLGILGVEGGKEIKIARGALDFTGIAHLADRRITRLSGGEFQRVMIARAICQESEIMVLDEPTAALDLAHQIRIMDLMEKLRCEKGVTIIMVSHDINLSAMYADRMLLLKNGKMVKLGQPRDVITEDLLKEAYGCTILLDQNPVGPFPRINLLPGDIMSK